MLFHSWVQIDALESINGHVDALLECKDDVYAQLP